MRIVTIREKYQLCNWMKEAVSVQCFSVPLSYEKVTLDHERADIIDLEDRKELSIPLLLWTVLAADSEETTKNDPFFVQYLCFSFRSQSGGLTQSDDQSKSLLQMDGSEWSYPIRIRSNETGSRQNFAMPMLEGEFCRTCACVLTSQCEKIISYLTVSRDHHPSIEIHNNCNLMLHFGQTLHGVSSPGKNHTSQSTLDRNTSSFMYTNIINS